MKNYAVGTQDHYYYLFDKILICNSRNSFYEEISKELSDSFYCMPFLLGGRFTKRFTGLSSKEKQLTVTYCEERSLGRLTNFRNG